jgi:hypothetical protein
MSAELAFLLTLTPAERQELRTRCRAQQVVARARATARADVRARNAVLRSLRDPRLLAKVEAAKAHGELVESRETPGLWFMGAYAEQDPVRLFLHATIGLVVGVDGSSFIEPWARTSR